MAIYGGFSPAALGMLAQSYNMKVIGGNIANVSTGGYKGTQSRFQTVLSDTITNQSDLGGVRSKDYQNISGQGQIMASSRELDIAISGKGFFVLNSDVNGTGQEYYTRDGSLDMQLETDTTNGYLTNKTGHYVMGWAADTGGVVDTSGALTAIQIDPDQFTTIGEATTEATMNLNLPSTAEEGDVFEYRMQVYDSNFEPQSVTLQFTRTATDNEWDVQTLSQGAPTAQVNTLTLGGTVETGDTYSVTISGRTVSYTTQASDTTIDDVRTGLVDAINADSIMSAQVTAAAGGAGALTLTADTAGSAFTPSLSAVNGGATADNTLGQTIDTANDDGKITSTAQTISFNGKGQLTGAAPLSFTFAFDGGSTGTVAFDFENTTQYNGDFVPLYVTKNGQGIADLRTVEFDKMGNVLGRFSDDTKRVLYRLALGTFTNENGLQKHDGNIFSETEDSGEVTHREASYGGYGTFSPNSYEISNVNMEQEFSNMIITQNAYNSSATVLRTVDEMLTTARDLKR